MALTAFVSDDLLEDICVVSSLGSRVSPSGVKAGCLLSSIIKIVSPSGVTVRESYHLL